MTAGRCQSVVDCAFCESRQEACLGLCGGRVGIESAPGMRERNDRALNSGNNGTLGGDPLAAALEEGCPVADDAESLSRPPPGSLQPPLPVRD